MKLSTIELFDWIKHLPTDLIDLTSSGIYGPQKLSDLKLEVDDLPLRGDNYYGYKPLKEIIASRYRVKTCNVAITPGASMANYALLSILAGRDDQIMIETPCYQPFVKVAEALTGTPSLRLPREKQNGYHIDPEYPGLKRNTYKVLLLSNPHNPTGVYDSIKTYLKLAEYAERYDYWIVVDEVFLPFLDSGDSECAASHHERIISTCSLTKVWGLNGLRVGWIIAPAHIVKRIEYAMDYMHVNQTYISDYIAWLVLSNDAINNKLLSFARNRAKQNWKLVESFLSESQQLEYTPPSAGVSVLVRFQDGRNSEEFVNKLSQDYGTLVTPGKYFEVEDGFRISFASQKNQVLQGMEQIKKALNFFDEQNKPANRRLHVTQTTYKRSDHDSA